MLGTGPLLPAWDSCRADAGIAGNQLRPWRSHGVAAYPAGLVYKGIGTDIVRIMRASSARMVSVEDITDRDCANARIEGHMGKDIKTELRGFKRFSPKKDVTVALICPPQECESNLIGSLADISRSGLAFSYLPFGAEGASTKGYVMVSLLGPHIPLAPIRCKKVYEVDFLDKSQPSTSARRVGLEFLITLSASELQTVVSG